MNTTQYFFVFKARADLFRFYEQARAMGYAAKITSAPSRLALPCSLVVRITPLSAGYDVLDRGEYLSFAGAFLAKD